MAPNEMIKPLLSSVDEDCEWLIVQAIPAADEVKFGSDDTDPVDGTVSTPAQRHEKIPWLVLAVLIFFNSAGGPFGVEPALRAAGNLYTIIGYALMPFILSIPEAIMTYELSSSYPCPSGGVRFTTEAFGEFWGLLVGYLGWVAGISHIASLPSLFFSFIKQQFFPHIFSNDNWILIYVILAGISSLLTYVNYRGFELVTRTILLIYVVSMTPFVLLVIIGIPKVDMSKWLQTPTSDNIEIDGDNSFDEIGWFVPLNVAGIALRPFINNLYWKFNGYDQASHYSTTVSKKNLRNGIAGSIVLASFAHLLPLLIITGATNIKQDEWSAGSFAAAGTEIGGRWLGNWIVISAGISLLAQFFSDMAAESMMIHDLASQGRLPTIFCHHSPYNTPTYAFLLSLLLIMALLPLPFTSIVELSNISSCFCLVIEFSAFFRLAICDGDRTRFRRTVYAVFFFLAMAFIFVVIALATYASFIYLLAVFVLGVLLIHASKIGSGVCCFW